MKNKLEIVFVSCWYQGQIYSNYTWQLQNRLLKMSPFVVRTLTSECACGANRQLKRTNLFNSDCTLIPTSFTHHGDRQPRWLGKIAGKLQILKTYYRGKRYAQAAAGADLIHFQQVTDAFGSLPLFSFLRSKTTGKKIVTVHELDAFQLKHRYLNRIYNRADKVIVHSDFMRQHLCRLGVTADKIVVIPVGKNLPQFDTRTAEGLIFYGGHHLFSGKGFLEFLQGIKILADQNNLLPVKIFGGFSFAEESKARRLITEMGLNRWVEFLHEQDENKIDEIYQRSRLAVIPFIAGSGAQAVTMALMNGTPILASRTTDIPEYADGHASYLNEVTPQAIAREITRCLQNGAHKEHDQILQYARERFSWEVVSGKTLQVYQEVLR